MSTPESNGNQPPPVPRYGEYAPQQPAPAAPLPPYEQYPAQQNPAQQYPAQQYAQQPSQGQPQYPGQAQYYGQPYTTKPPVRIADTIISVVLLVVSFISTLFSLALVAGLDSFMQGQYDSYDLGTYEPGTAFIATQATIIVSHLVLLAISTPITIVLIVKRKISFWVPLTAGVIATIVLWGALLTLSFTDEAILGELQTQSETR